MSVPYLAIANALEFLANRTDYSELKKEFSEVANLPHCGFLGEYQTLNVLLECARGRGEDWLDPLWDLADSKHVNAFPERRKAYYQASYMAQRRQRLYAAERVRERLTGEALEGAERKRFRKAMQAYWTFQRNELLECRSSDDDHNEIVQQFWADIDRQLAEAEAGDDEVARRVLGMNP